MLSIALELGLFFILGICFSKMYNDLINYSLNILISVLEIPK